MGVIEELRETGRGLEEKAEKYEDLRARAEWEEPYNGEWKGFKINCKVGLVEEDSRLGRFLSKLKLAPEKPRLRLREVYIEGELEEPLRQKRGEEVLNFLQGLGHSPKMHLEAEYESLDELVWDIEERKVKVDKMEWNKDGWKFPRGMKFEGKRYTLFESYSSGYRKCEGEVKAEELDECYEEPHFKTLPIKELEKEILPLHRLLIGKEAEEPSLRRKLTNKLGGPALSKLRLTQLISLGLPEGAIVAGAFGTGSILPVCWSGLPFIWAFSFLDGLADSYKERIYGRKD